MQKIKHRIIIDTNLWISFLLTKDLSKINTKAEFITIKSTVAICRDAKNNFLLALAKDGKASHLITGDSDLLVLNKISKTEILTISSYLSKA